MAITHPLLRSCREGSTVFAPTAQQRFLPNPVDFERLKAKLGQLPSAAD